jgi:hypothetical protein
LLLTVKIFEQPEQVEFQVPVEIVVDDEELEYCV